MIRTANPQSLLHVGNGDQHRQKVHNHFEGDVHEDEKFEESPSGADEEKKGDDADTTMLGDYEPAIASPPPTIKDEMQSMFVRLLFSQRVVESQ